MRGGCWLMIEGVNMLRAARGAQMVSFSDVADHLFDYAERNPDHREAIDRFATFLAVVEQVPHDHDADPDRGLPAPFMASDPLVV